MSSKLSYIVLDLQSKETLLYLSAPGCHCIVQTMDQSRLKKKYIKNGFIFDIGNQI